MSDDEERMSVGSRGSFRVEERPDRDFLDKGSRTASTLSAATLASLGGASSRRGSCDTSFSVETEASIRDMKESLVEAEEKYRKAMVSNAQLHNEKTTLMYQVETLKEELSDMEELLWESRRHCDDRSKELEREHQAHSVLQFQFKEMKETLRQTEELLTKHGVIVSPEVSTNGETAQGEDEDDVSAESAARLAQEVSHGGRESMLGKVREQQSAESSKFPQDNMKYNRGRIIKCSQSLNVIPTNDPTKPDTLKPVKRFDKQDRERRDGMEKHAVQNEGTRKPRNNGSEKELNKKFHIRQEGNSLLRSEGIKKQLKNEPRTAARMCETKSAVGQLVVDDQAFNGRTEPHCESGVQLSVASNQDVLVTETERSFDNQMCRIQINHGRSQLLVRQSECLSKCGDVVSPVHRGSTEKVHKSQLFPPQSAKDIILDNRAIMAAGKQNSLTQKKQTTHVAVVMGNESPSYDRDVSQKCLSAVENLFDNQNKDAHVCRDVSCSEGENKNKINEFITLTSVDSLKENESFDKMAEVDGEGYDGPSFEDEDTKVLTDFVEKEGVVMLVKTNQSLGHHKWTVSEKLGSTINEDQAIKNESDSSYFSVSKGRSFETNPEPSEFDAFLPSEEGDIEEMLGTSEKPEKSRSYEEEPVRKANKIQEKTEGDSSECLECNILTETLKTSTLSSLVPVETLKDWSGLEKTIKSMLQGFLENYGLAAEFSRFFPDIPGSLNQWISDFEEMLKNAAENVSDQRDTDNQDSTGQTTGTAITAEDEPPLKDLAGGKKTPQDPDNVEQSSAGCSVLIKNCLVSGKLEAASLEVLPQTNEDSMKVCEDALDSPVSEDQEATENTSEVMFSICKFKVEVTESSPEKKPVAKSVDVAEESLIDSKVMSCSEEFLFVESYFAESAKNKMLDCGPDLGLVDSPRNQVVDASSKTSKEREVVCRSQSCLVIPVEEVEMQLKRHRPLSTNSQVGQSSKVRRLLEITADEIKAMALPELVLMSQQEGRITEHQQTDKSTGSDTEDVEELSVGEMDSCEEAEEEAEQQPATQQQRQPVRDVVVEDVKVVPVTSVKHLKGFSLGSRKTKHKTDCKIS